MSRDGSLTRGIPPIGSTGNRLATWLVDSGPTLEKTHREFVNIEKSLSVLNQLLQQIEMLHVATVGAGDSEVRCKPKKLSLAHFKQLYFSR